MEIEQLENLYYICQAVKHE